MILVVPSLPRKAWVAEIITVEWETLTLPCAQGPTLSSPGTNMAPMTRYLGSVGLVLEKGETDGFRITSQCD